MMEDENITTNGTNTIRVIFQFNLSKHGRMCDHVTPTAFAIAPGTCRNLSFP